MSSLAKESDCEQCLFCSKMREEGKMNTTEVSCGVHDCAKVCESFLILGNMLMRVVKYLSKFWIFSPNLYDILKE